MPLSGPLLELTLTLDWLTFTFNPPGSAIVRRTLVRRVVRRVRVVTRLRTVLVRARFTAGRAELRRFAAGFRVLVFRRVTIVASSRLGPILTAAEAPANPVRVTPGSSLAN